MTTLGIACIVTALIVGVPAWLIQSHRAGRKIDAAMPTLLDGPRCAVLACNQPGTVWVFDRLLCTDDAAAIRNRTPYDQARTARDDVLDGRAS